MSKLQDKLKGLTDAITRFPLTILFLLAAAIINAYDIGTESDPFSKYMLACLVGASLSAVAQVAYERFFSKVSARLLLMGGVVLLTAGYYLIIMPAPTLSMEMMIRTAVALFGLLFAFIWVPVIKSDISFNKSFMISFKSLFNSLFFSGVIFAGISIILTATNELIFEIDSDSYAHSGNIIFVLFAPMYFLSLIPIYLGLKDKGQEKVALKKEEIDKKASCPKFLEILISYILIPLITVFTLILVTYIIKNVGGEFWKDNLLEPMLVSYSITVILVYILASELENKFTVFFRKIFPKLLVPIVIFQIISSFLVINDTGVTHNRYFVILFGIFAAIVGLLLSFLSVRKNGLIAAVLIVFATISIVPPVDAFTVSRVNQTDRMETVLVKNNMLENNQIKPNDSISDKDKQTITTAIQYLSMMEYTKKIDWIPDNFDVYQDFKKTFGFSEYQKPDEHYQGVYLGTDRSTPINIKDFDTFVTINLSMNEKNNEEKIFEFEKEGKQYTMLKVFNKEQTLKLIGENDQELISFNTQELYDRFSDYTATKELISVDEATFTKENQQAKISIVVQNISLEKQNQQYNNAEIYLFVQIK